MKRLSAALLLLLGACASTPPPPVASEKMPLPAPPPTGEPGDLIGLTGPQLQAKLGVPAFSRKEYGSEMWRYDTKQCRVFFFLYPAGTGLFVRHVETMPHGKGVAADPVCLTALRGKPASPAS